MAQLSREMNGQRYHVPLSFQRRGPRQKRVTDRGQGELTFDPSKHCFPEVHDKIPTNRILSPPDQAVILSEAPRRSIANRKPYGAESKDPGDACWQMLSGAFRPQTTTQGKK